jgi:hypothetical protein
VMSGGIKFCKEKERRSKGREWRRSFG